MANGPTSNNGDNGLETIDNQKYDWMKILYTSDEIII